MFQKTFYRFILITLLIINTAYASSNIQNKETNPEDISLLITPIVNQYRIPGMIAAIVSSHTIEAIGVDGVRKLGSQNKMTIHDLFHIGSNTKSMTATLIALLIQKKLLHWNTKVIDIFPDLKEKIDPAFKDLTLEKLLTHRGGVISDIDYDQIQLTAKNDLVKARQLAMEQALTSPPAVTPGTFHYSNMDYVIAGHMAEKVTGQSWESLMEHYLFSPLNMTSAGFGPPSQADSLEQPVGHHENGQPLAPNEYGDNPAMIGPAGTVHLSIFDWIKYIRFHLQGAEGKQQTILKLNMFKKLQAPITNPPPPYAMGWIVDKMPWANGNVLVHAGSNELWYAKVWIAPKRDIAILIIINQGGKQASAASNATASILMQHYLHLPKAEAIDNSAK